MSDEKPGISKTPAAQTLTRRTLLQWFGSASVVSLASLAVGCGTSSETAPATGDPGGAAPDQGSAEADPGASSSDAGSRDAGSRDVGSRDVGSPDDASAPASTGDSGAGANGIRFKATPDSETTISPWGENTVDPQDEATILETWSLTVDGMVESPVTLDFAALLALERQNQITDFHCVEGWSVYDIPWNGVHLSKLLELVNPDSTATHVTFHSVQAPNGQRYDESLPLNIALEPKTMLAYGADDLALPLRHGFPLRLVIPRLLGYKNAKTLERIELTDHPIDGFWVKRGYGYDALVPEQRLREGKY